MLSNPWAAAKARAEANPTETEETAPTFATGAPFPGLRPASTPANDDVHEREPANEHYAAEDDSRDDAESIQGDGGSWTPEAVDNLAGFFASTPGLTPSTLDHARDWFERTYLDGERPAEKQKVTHPYGNLSGFGFTDLNLPYVHALGNHLAAKGASADEFYGILRRFTDELLPRAKQHQASASRETAQQMPDLAAQDRADARQVASEMRQHWGPEYRSNIAEINHYLDSLPPAERRQIETETVSNSNMQLILNTRTGLNRLLSRARASMLSAAVTGTAPAAVNAMNEAAISAEINQIEAARRKDRKAYDKNDALQFRVRELYGAWQRTTGREWGR